MRKHCLRNYLECPVESKDLTQPIYMEKNRGRCRYVRIKPENVMHARRKGIGTTTVDLAEIARSSVSGDLSTKSSNQVNHAPEEGTNGPQFVCQFVCRKASYLNCRIKLNSKKYQTRGGSKAFAQMNRMTNERQTATAGDKFLAHWTD